MPYIDQWVCLPETLCVKLGTSVLHLVNLVSLKCKDTETLETSVGVSI